MNEIEKARRIQNSDEILSKNCGVNRKTVAAHKRLEAELEKLGIENKPSYKLDPPLGSNSSGRMSYEKSFDRCMNKSSE